MDLFKELINMLNPLLKELGFSKKGNNFYFEIDKNYGVINFQKSRESTKEIVSFTINFGIYSDFLGKSQYFNKDSAKPEIEQCQWQSRVGHFMPNNPDYWWKVNLSTDLNIISANVIAVVQDIIVPEINKRLSDEDLMSSWMNEDFTGTTEIGRFKYLTTLLKSKGDFDKLNQVVHDFMEKSKGKPNASIAMEHLKGIDYIQ